MLAFIATADLEDLNVRSKYLDKIVYDYTLAKFRESGYTKDFKNMQGDYGGWPRTLGALILSEYRRHLFGDAIQYLKEKDSMLNSLVSDLKLGFSQDKAMIVSDNSADLAF